LKCIGKVYEQAKECKLEEAFFKQAARELNVISDYFHTSSKQSLIVALVFALNYDQSCSNLQNLIKYLGCNPMKFLDYGDEMEDLFTKEIIQKQDTSEKGLIMLSSTVDIILNQKILEAIMKNEPMPSLEKEKPKNQLEVLEAFYLLGVQRDEEEISSIDLFVETERFFNSSLHYPLIKRIDELNLDMEDLTIYLYVIWKTITGDDKIDLERALRGIFDNTAQRIGYLHAILKKNNALIYKNLVENTEGEFLNDAALKLTDYSLTLLQESDIPLFLHKKSRDTIDPAKISPVALFFNETEHRQLEFLKALMQEEHFAETQTRLQKKGMPKGITILFHGLPGTGKTETVYQFAKDTGREIFKVDMSQLKSKWFGESEKIVKRVFTDYRACSKNCERTPVLLFNEADAVISKRRDIGNSNVGQTENAIQNIILEELENFEGILFATTNLVSNLDPAFERRFLFKVEFQKPDMAVKAKIWNSKLPNLSKTECEALATQFDFSGGQINNIVRKKEIHEIVYGLSVDFNNIVDYCKTELLSKNNGNLIGFTKG
jgi:hypothetical protein